MTERSGKCPHCGKVVELGPAGDPALCPHCQEPLGPPQPHQDAPGEPLIGQTLGEFEVVELLGSGGMGAVYKACQPSLARFVAVKVLPQALGGDERFVVRFEREARAAAAVNHPNIIQIYHVGQDGGNRYIAMELVDGDSLSDHLKNHGPMSADRALEAMEQAAAALAEAHAAGIVHRDIKPANILLTARGQVKIADFGLAKRTEMDADVTQAGRTLGTPRYMPPEVARGQPYDARGDLYALGATFYHALTGQAPFPGATTAEVIAKLLETDLPPLREVAPRTSPALCRVIHRLLEKDPAKRYASADELLQDLRRVRSAPDGSLGDLVAALENTPPPPSAPKAIPVAAARTPPRGTRLPDVIPVARKAEPNRALLAGVAAGLALVIGIGIVVISVRSKGPPGGQPAPGTPGSAPASLEGEYPATAWQDLFDGQTLRGWKVIDQGRFAQHGNVFVQDGCIRLQQGSGPTGILWTGSFPTANYELSVEAFRTVGRLSVLSVVFPVAQSGCALHAGGSANGSVAIDLIDGRSADNNETTIRMGFVNGRWYRVRLRVTDAKIEAWIDDRRVIDFPTAGRTLTVPGDLAPSKPFGLGTCGDVWALRNIRLRRLK